MNASSGSRLPALFGGWPRLLAAAAAVAVGIAVLWQAGVLFQPEDVGGGAAALEPPRLDLEAAGPRPVGVEEGQSAPDFEFSAFDGRRLRLSGFRGRPVVLNFWASWCVPCRAEMPLLESAIREHADAGLAVIGVNNGERYQTASRFLERLDVSLTAYAYDPDGAVVRRYAILGMPTTFFIDREGVITSVIAGALTQSLLDNALAGAIRGHGR